MKDNLNEMMDSQLKDILIAYSTSFTTKAKCLVILIKRKINA